MTQQLPGEVDELLSRHAGVITRAQALAAGMTRHAIQARLDSGRWQRLHVGVYAVYSGRPTRESLLWAAVLGVRSGGVLCHQTAAELHGLQDVGTGRKIHVMVPCGHSVAALTGVVIHYSRRVQVARHPALEPPRTRLEETVLDLAEAEATTTGAISWILTACASRKTKPDRLLQAMDSRPRIRRRKILLAALGDARIGVESILEHGYLYRVERAHGLPAGLRQRRTRVGGAPRYEDVRYEKYGVIVELDGQAAHPEGERWQDIRRDNLSAMNGWITLRYSYADVMERPCEIADEIVRALRARGYTGGAHRCGPSCAPGDPTVLADAVATRRVAMMVAAAR
ncbi:MAG TPA: type IV toxin-antitoxin system AbiEi family antitoxin domain-containing protein [Streptosporangiaceae bacterium]|jgi:very-short-patch-repair endonuclease|nr:type IV toxin-antitoxin system AbiEi family antitoxin domain-containing protein [Streptosporangiaceae bacterium]